MKALLIAAGVNGTNIINDTALKAFEDADIVSLDAPRNLAEEIKGYDLVIIGIDFIAPFKDFRDLVPAGTIPEGKLIVLTSRPFKFEGENRMATANAGILEATKMADLVLVQNNEVLLSTPTFNEEDALAGLSNEPLHDSFKAIVKNFVITKSIDEAEVKAVLNQEWLENGLIEAYANNFDL